MVDKNIFFGIKRVAEEKMEEKEEREEDRMLLSILLFLKGAWR